MDSPEEDSTIRHGHAKPESGAGPKDGPPPLASETVASCPVHAKMTLILYVNGSQVCHESDTSTLILCVDEVWRERRSDCFLRPGV